MSKVAAFDNSDASPAQKIASITAPLAVCSSATHIGLMQLATIGYENATQPEVIDRLKAAGVKTVIDVRAIAASRRAGFSKTLLAASLQEAGIAYVHLRQLGTPKPGRDAARAGRVAEMAEIFETHMQEPAAQLQLAHAGEIASGAKSALLCYEAEACGCHRRILANNLAARLGFEIQDL